MFLLQNCGPLGGGKEFLDYLAVHHPRGQDEARRDGDGCGWEVGGEGAHLISSTASAARRAMFPIEVANCFDAELEGESWASDVATGEHPSVMIPIDVLAE